MKTAKFQTTERSSLKILKNKLQEDYLMKKRIVSLLACGALAVSSVAGFAACSGGDAVKLTVWGSAAQQETLSEMTEAFKRANPDKKYDIKLGISEEQFAFENVQRDPDSAADVYSYSNDQLIPLLRVGGLAELGGLFLDNVKAENSEESVRSGSIAWGTADEKVYGYPFASDNGYFMYYDKSVLTEDDVTSLEKIIAACEKAGKQIGWALNDPWYTAGWFFSFGCSYSVEYDYNNNFKEGNIEIDFNSEGGIKASKAMSKLVASSALVKGTVDNAAITTGFATKKYGVGVSGTWIANSIKESLGENYGVCKLPTVTVDGETQQLYSYMGYKLFGVNPHSKNLVEAHRLAAFLSGADMQQTRFEKHLTGPTNKTVAALDAVKNDPTFAALNLQNLYSVEQTSVPSSFWSPVGSYGQNILDNLVSDNPTGGQISYQSQLDAMVKKIKGN